MGALFRTADAVAVAKIYLTGYTPKPVDRFERAVSKIAKTALGAEKSIPWEHYLKIDELIIKLKTDGIKVVAVEQVNEAINYKKLKLDCPTALLFGNEVAGISKEVIQQCDLVVEIPMLGAKESLNVSVAVGVVVFSLRDLS